MLSHLEMLKTEAAERCHSEEQGSIRPQSWGTFSARTPKAACKAKGKKDIQDSTGNCEMAMPSMPDVVC